MKENNIKYLNIIKMLIVLTLLLIQILTVYFLIVLFNELGTYSYLLIEVIGVMIALRILGSNKKYIYKLSWTVFLVVVPITAIVFYLLYGNQIFIKKIKKKEQKISDEIKVSRIQNEKIIDDLTDERLKTDIKSIYNLSSFTAYQSEDNEYFATGKLFFTDMVEKLKTAEKFILIEFYILARGNLFNEISEILIEKAKSGVEIYIIYDKLGSINRFNSDDENYLRKNGINIVAFNKKIGKLYTFINYRTHCKIVVIDGVYSYTGGNNLADEYINIGSKYGYWKDMGVRIQGPASNSFIYAFFKTWILVTNTNVDVKKYYVNNTQYSGVEDKIVIPFTDEPTNSLEIASHNYMRIIANSKKYVYITTPYLIIDEEMITSLKLAAKSGVDVKIIIPGIADKKFIYEVTKAHCLDLILAGVEIYKYDPGFIHGKTIVSDDMFTTIGSVNFDYRSLMWNYECAIYAYDKSLSMQVKNDFEGELLQSTCINEQYIKEQKITTNILYGVYRLIGPLL